MPLRETERERVAFCPSRALRKGSKPLFRGILAVADREAVKSRDSLFAGPSAPEEERRGEESSSSSASRVSYRRLYRCRYAVARRCTRVHVRYKPADLAPTLAHPAKPICLLITGAHTCQFIRRQKTTRERGCTWQWESRKARFRAINEHRWRINPPLYFSFFSSFLLRLPLYTCTLSVQLACSMPPPNRSRLPRFAPFSCARRQHRFSSQKVDSTRRQLLSRSPISPQSSIRRRFRSSFSQPDIIISPFCQLIIALYSNRPSLSLSLYSIND